jgi:2-keto-4-pentenoate hydratase
MDPLEPLTRLANELSRTGIGLRAGEVVGTGPAPAC